MSGGAKIYVGNLSWNTNDELLGQVSVGVVDPREPELTLRSPRRLSPSSVRSPTFVSPLRWVSLPILLCLASHRSLSLLSLGLASSTYVVCNYLYLIRYIKSLVSLSALVSFWLSSLSLSSSLPVPSLVFVVVCGFLASFPYF